ncbi:MAG: hypothetical protein ACRC5H_09980, partial [Treponemataceae bacterium]
MKKIGIAVKILVPVVLITIASIMVILGFNIYIITKTIDNLSNENIVAKIESVVSNIKRTINIPQFATKNLATMLRYELKKS